MGGGFSLIQTSFAAASADQDHGEEKKTVVVKLLFLCQFMTQIFNEG